MKKFSLSKYIYFSLNCLILLLFLVSLPFPGLGTTRILSGFIVIVLLALKWNKVKSRFLFYFRKEQIQIAFILYGACFLIALVHSSLNTGVTNSYNEAFSPQYVIYILLYSFILPLYCLVSFDSIKEFVIAWLLVILAEAMIVMAGVVNHDFAVYIFEHYYDSERFVKTVERGSRIVGIGIAGASGGIAMSTGIMALSYLYIREQIPSILYFTLGTIILLATLFVGRTGVLCSLVYIAVTFIFRRQSIKTYIILPLAVFALLWGLNYLLSQTLQADGLLEWMTEAFQSEAREELMGEIYDNYNLPFSILGTGFTRGSSGDAYCHSDSGYLQSYFAFGVIGFVCYYMAAFLLLRGSMDNCRGKIKKFLFVALIIAFAIEAKEGFFMRYVNSFMVVALSLFSSYESSAFSIKRDYKTQTQSNPPLIPTL